MFRVFWEDLNESRSFCSAAARSTDLQGLLRIGVDRTGDERPRPRDASESGLKTANRPSRAGVDFVIFPSSDVGEGTGP